jgi:hypothetical protein
VNAAEYITHIKDRMAAAPVGSLRHAMYVREGVDETDRQICRDLRVWAVERFDWHRPETAMVFGTCRSDALRRAQAPARLGESFAHTQWRVGQITSGWDEPVVWPLEAA